MQVYYRSFLDEKRIKNSMSQTANTSRQFRFAVLITEYGLKTCDAELYILSPKGKRILTEIHTGPDCRNIQYFNWY